MNKNCYVMEKLCQITVRNLLKDEQKVFPEKFADKETLSYDRDKTTH